MTPKAQRRFLNEVLDHQTALVDTCLEYGVFDHQDIRNRAHSDGETFIRPVSDWYLITEQLGATLALSGYIVLINEYGVWLGVETDTKLFNICEEVAEVLSNSE
jgi:hypothetical protein